jgi:hypothetical protein
MSSFIRRRFRLPRLVLASVVLVVAHSPSIAIAQEAAATSHRSLVTAEYREEAVAAINARNRLFEQNILLRNSKKLIDEYFVPDEWGPILLGPKAPPVRGRAAILEDFSKIGAGLSTLRIETLEIEVGHDMASEIGRVHLTDLNDVVRVGRYTVLWLKTEKGWRAKMDYFSSDAWPD